MGIRETNNNQPEDWHRNLQEIPGAWAPEPSASASPSLSSAIVPETGLSLSRPSPQNQRGRAWRPILHQPIGRGEEHRVSRLHHSLSQTRRSACQTTRAVSGASSEPAAFTCSPATSTTRHCTAHGPRPSSMPRKAFIISELGTPAAQRIYADMLVSFNANPALYDQELGATQMWPFLLQLFLHQLHHLQSGQAPRPGRGNRLTDNRQ